MKDKEGDLLSENVASVNRILPHKHKYAWDLFLKSCANNWMPTEISMQSDIKQWKNNEITEDEKLLVKRCLGFFAVALRIGFTGVRVHRNRQGEGHVI